MPSKDSKRRVRLFAYGRLLRRYRRWWVIALACGTGALLLRLPMPLLTGYVIDRVITARNEPALDVVCSVLLVVTLAYIALSYVSDYLIFLIRQRAAIRLQLKLVDHIHRLPLLTVEQTAGGYWVSRILDDPVHLQALVGQAINFGNSLALLAMGVITIFALSARLAAACLGSVLVFCASFYLCRGTLRALDCTVKEQQALLIARLTQSLNAIRVVKLYQLHIYETRQVRKQLHGQFMLRVRQYNYEYLLSAFPSLIVMCAPILVVWYGGLEVMSGRLTLGKLIAFSSVLGFLYSPARSLLSTQSDALKSLVSLDRVFDILEEPIEAPLPPHVEVPPFSSYSITVRDLSFRYGSGPMVLRNVSFDVRSGESVGVVGPTGAGKSTIVHLIARLYQPQDGHIEIGGVDISGMLMRHLRSTIGVLPQHPFLFSATVADNIRLGKPSATDAEVEAAAKRANVYDIIKSLPGGFQTNILNDGRSLSGGEVQLICLARLLLRDCPVLLFDEPTSSVDSATEILLVNALSALKGEKTILLVSHRLSTLRNVDRIAVFDGGGLSAFGDYQHVSRANAFFRALIGSQSAQPNNLEGNSCNGTCLDDTVLRSIRTHPSLQS
jgi:ABC-type multidrug transport system fused ATPase/permease subunit